LTLFYARYALKEVTTSRHNFNSVMQSVEAALVTLAKAQARMSPVDAATMQETQSTLSEKLQYLAMYVYGLLKSSVISPTPQIPPNSPYLDTVAHLNFQISHMSPEEVLPIFYPQVYDVSDPNLNEGEFP